MLPVLLHQSPSPPAPSVFVFEKGGITYRTDSVALSDEAIAMARAILEQHHPEALAPAPVRYRNSDTPQEAHEAIRPTSPAVEAEVTLSVDEEALLGLISKSLLAWQCRPARVAHTTVRTRGGELRFLATGTTVLFPPFVGPGWTAFLAANSIRHTRIHPGHAWNTLRGEESEIGRVCVAPRPTERSLCDGSHRH